MVEALDVVAAGCWSPKAGFRAPSDSSPQRGSQTERGVDLCTVSSAIVGSPTQMCEV
jgi:hypothetical protein